MYREFRKPIHLRGSRQSLSGHQSGSLVRTVSLGFHQIPDLFPKHHYNYIEKFFHENQELHTVLTTCFNIMCRL